jgi:hypothetical protein
MSSSFTIWYKRKLGTTAKPSLELHINLWIHNKEDEDSIDFGLLISKPQVIEELYVYIPFLIEDKNITNLTKMMATDKKTSDLVFNENVNLREHSGQIQKTTISGQRIDYYLLDGHIINELDENKLEEGCILKFIFDTSLSPDKKYIRFRVDDIKDKGIVEHYTRSASYITGTYNVLTSMEINFHEFRKLPDDVYQKAEPNHLKISLVNLFVMTDIHMEYTFSNILNVKSRILEKEKWVDYNNKLRKTKNDKILAYQFKKKAAKRKIGFSQFAPTPMNPDPFNITEEPMYLNDFSLFAKFNEEGARKRNVFFAILVAFSLGLGGSLTASYIDKNNFNLSDKTVSMYNIIKNYVISSDDNKSDEQ